MLKKAFRSNTIQFNFIALVLLILAEAGKLDIISSNPERAAIVAGAIALINVLLRFKTKKPIKER
jgi:hypothetical protein